MAPPNGNRQPWFMLPYNWDMDDCLISLPEGAKLLFVKIVEFCCLMQNGGTLTDSQLHSLSKGLTRGRQCVDRLIASGALSADSSLTDGRRTVSITHTARWLQANNGPPPISAGKRVNAPAKTAGNVPRGDARENLERKKEREEERTPSGSVRSSSAQAAPRVAGGATQPAPDPEVDGGRKLSGAEAMAEMRRQIKQTQATNPNSTGRDTVFSKWDPNRPIEPINSALQNGWDGE